MKRYVLSLACVLLFSVTKAQKITIRADDTGRTFEGIGALSAGASSRLLIDYPEPYRNDILDFLFKPKFGANLWQLKVENGGDINSTDGSELAYAHTKEEFLHPETAYFNRGYEWWLIKEAKRRNPDIKVEILQWGAPGWIDSFYSIQNAEFITKYIKGLKQYRHINIDYTGIRNEVMYHIPWIKLLHKILDSTGLSDVKIDAGDQWKPGDQWQIAKDISKDTALARAVYAINAHVPEDTHFKLPSEAFELNKPIWSGESHARGGDWEAAKKEAVINNLSYILAKITRVIYWSLITSYPEFLSAPKSGMMEANTPWSGHYEVQPPLWIYAHINQFAKPGWKYINDGCQYFQKQGWSVITLKDTATNNYSLIIETMDAKEPHTIHFKLQGNLSAGPLSVWESSFKKFLFKKQRNITPFNQEFSIAVQPNSIYSLTTTRGQHKGTPEHAIPPAMPFPKIYKDNFNHDSLHREPPYFINYHGAFEVVKDKESGNRYLKQCSHKQGINWFSQPYPRILLGDSSWRNVRISVDFLIPDTGIVRIASRLHNFSWNSRVPGYCFEIHADGQWQLKLTDKDIILKRGRYEPLDKKWHHLQFNCIGDEFTILIDKRQIVHAQDDQYQAGVIALATGWNVAYFDNFEVERE